MGLAGVARPTRVVGVGQDAFLLVGRWRIPGRWRAVLAESEDQPHLVGALDRVCRGLGGVTRTWRFDRMATVCDPGTGRVTASFAAVAKHYGVSVAICPARRGNRKGVVEKANHTAAQRWWRTLADEVTAEQAQASWTGCPLRGDTRLRPTADGRATVATVAGASRWPLPRRRTRRSGRVADGVARRRWSPSAATATRCHPSWPAPRSRCPTGSAPAHRPGHQQRDHHRPPPAGRRRARRHRPRHRARPGPGTRGDGRVHHAAPHRRKQRIPPGPAARARRRSPAQLPRLQAPTTRRHHQPHQPTPPSSTCPLRAAAQGRTIP